MKRLFAISLLGTFLCASCAIGPDYKRPMVPVQSKWKNSAETQGEEKSALLPWWEVFHDPELNLLEEAAVANNQDLKVAVAKVLEARATARVTVADFFPTIDAVPSANWSQASTKVKTSSPFPVQRSTLKVYNAPLDLSYEIDVWGKIRRHFESASAKAEATQEDYRTVLLTLTADVAQNYFLLRSLDAEDVILKRTIEFRRDSLEVNRAKYKSGLTSEIDVSRAEVELATAEVEASEIIRQRAQIENGLAILTGRLPSDLLLVANPLSALPPTIPPGLPSELLKRRPDIAEAERSLQSSCAQIGVAKGEFFPVFRLTGSMGFESSDLSSVFAWPARTWSFGPSITIPIFEGGRNLANYRVAKARYEGALAQYRQKVLVAFRDVEDALVDLKQKSEQAKAHERSVQAGKLTVQLSRVRYEKGLTNYLEVIDAERSLLQAQRGAQQTLGQRLLATVRLIKALGGGW